MSIPIQSKSKETNTSIDKPKRTQKKQFNDLAFIQKLKKGDISQMLSSFISKANEISRPFKEIRQKFFERNIPIEAILKEELSKPILNLTTKMSSKVITQYSRDIQKIKICLSQIEGIARYLKFNCINDRTFIKAIGYMKYESFDANTYIFRQGEVSDKFYGVISGHVSIRARKTFKKNKIAVNSLEEEKTVFSAGMCLGEWGMIYSIPRTASAYTLTSAELFSIDKEAFEKTLSKEIIKSDQEKKAFVASCIPQLSNVSKYQNILTQIIPLFFDNKDIVYSEFDKAEYLYVLYQGECIMTKFLHPEKIEDIAIQRNKMVTLLKIDKGGILGLDTVNPNSNNSSNIIVTRDFTVLYRIKLNFLKECNIAVISFLRSMHQSQQELIHKAWKREVYQIEKRQKELMTQRKRNLSCENIRMDKITGLFQGMTKGNSLHKRKITLKICQKEKISFFPLSSRSKYTTYCQSISKRTKDKQATPLLFHCQTICQRTRNKSQELLIKKAQEKGSQTEKEEKETGDDMIKANRLINTFYSRNDRAVTRLASYNSGHFDLPLIG